MPIPQPLSRTVELRGLGHIRPRHNEMARRLVMGQKPVDVALTMGISENWLNIIINSPLFKIVLARLSKLRDEAAVDIKEELKELAPVALEQVAKTMLTGGSEKLRLAASQDILDRGGVVKQVQGGNLGVQININPVDLDKYKSDAVTVDVKAIEHKGDVSSVHPVNDSKAKDDGDLEEDVKLLDKALEEPVEEEVSG